jgi:hypothetical protein
MRAGAGAGDSLLFAASASCANAAAFRGKK